MNRAKSKPILYGIVASLLMAFFYSLIMYLSMSAKEAWFIFTSSWYLILGIIIGFGIQIGLWKHLKNSGLKNMSKTIPGASGAFSGTAMVTCCSHHLIDILPILGLTGISLFLTQYQRLFLAIGFSINLFGIAIILHLIKKSMIINNADYEKIIK